MQKQIANPIYDAVFKHLLEDVDVTKEMLSLLLDMEVLTLEVEPQEVTTPEQLFHTQMADLMLRVFRMDFLATVKTKDGKVTKVLIELQKAAAPDFIGRFRRYLGRQYQVPMQRRRRAGPKKDSKVSRITGEGHLPIVAVFLFGFEMSKKHPKVVRVQRQYVHYSTGEIIGERIPGMELLTHDAVMVQLSKVQEAGDRPLDEMLRVFDQNKCMKNMHYLEIDDATYEASSPLVKRMLRILTKAASDPETQRNMDAEDEVVSYVKELEESEEALEQAEAREQEALRQKEEERRQKEEAYRQKEEERRQKEEERRQKEEERRQKEEAYRREEDERRQKETMKAQVEALLEKMRRAGMDPDSIQ